MVGMGLGPFGHSLDPVVAKQLTIRGSFSHTWAVWKRVLALLADGGGEVVEQIVGWEGALEEWADGFKRQADGDVVKAMLRPQTARPDARCGRPIGPRQRPRTSQRSTTRRR